MSMPLVVMPAVTGTAVPVVTLPYRYGTSG